MYNAFTELRAYLHLLNPEEQLSEVDDMINIIIINDNAPYLNVKSKYNRIQ